MYTVSDSTVFGERGALRTRTVCVLCPACLLWNPVVASHESGVIRFANALQHQDQAKSTTINIQIRQHPSRYTAMHAGTSAGKKRAPTIFSLRSLLPAPQRGGPLLYLFFFST
jgi:hypothetical protein